MKQYKDVSDFLADLDPAKKEQVELLRAIITNAHPGLSEHIKWNAPSYVHDGKDRITFNLHNKENLVMLVLHMSASRTENKKGTPIMADDSGLISWRSDIRGVLTFTEVADIKAKQTQLSNLIARWLALQ